VRGDPCIDCNRLAYGIYKRASALAKEQLKALDGPTSKAEPVEPVVEIPVTEPVTPVVSTISTAETLVESVPEASPVAQMHREAQSSANTYVEIAGRRIQLTLRDDNEERLLQRLEKLLSRFSMPEQETEQQTATTPPEGWCPIHQVQMKFYSNKKGSWWSHRLDNNIWCNGKRNGK